MKKITVLFVFLLLMAGIQSSSALAATSDYGSWEPAGDFPVVNLAVPDFNNFNIGDSSDSAFEMYFFSVDDDPSFDIEDSLKVLDTDNFFNADLTFTAFVSEGSEYKVSSRYGEQTWSSNVFGIYFLDKDANFIEYSYMTFGNIVMFDSEFAGLGNVMVAGVTHAPVPSSMVLLVSGLLGIAGFRRKRIK